MEVLTSFERVDNVFNRRQYDRLPVAEDFWGDTITKWISEGHLQKDESLIEHFDLDLDRDGLVNCYADPMFGLEKLEENDNTVLYLDGNGAQLRQHKRHASTPEHVSFRIKDTKSWEAFAKPRLLMTELCRIPFDTYRKARAASLDKRRYFMSDAFGPFEMMQRAVGHEVLLLNMALDPEWIQDMVTTYAEFNIRHWEILFKRERLPYGTWIAEDLGYKFKPFMSPAMFEEILMPGYRLMFDYLHAQGLKVIMHSCGFIEPLLEMLIEAGLDCLEAMEFKAGMDLPHLFKKFGDRLVYFGNIDMRVLESNEKDAIKKELEDKILPVIRNGGRYILHSDHSISPKVEYDTFRHYLDMARNMTV